MRTQVMVLAHALRKAGESFSQAQKRAWAAIRIKVTMYFKPVTFRYVKDDGSERIATGFYGDAPKTSAEAKPGSPLVIKYFDLFAGWRSFRVDRLILS